MANKSDDCYRGQHDLCDGCNLDNQMGCMCPCHDQCDGPPMPDDEEDDDV